MGESGAPGFSLHFSRCCHGSPSVRADGSGMMGREGVPERALPGHASHELLTAGVTDQGLGGLTTHT